MKLFLAIIVGASIVLAPQQIRPCDTDRNCHIVWDDTSPEPYRFGEPYVN